jgi:hypothetical protein
VVVLAKVLERVLRRVTPPPRHASVTNARLAISSRRYPILSGSLPILDKRDEPNGPSSVQ